MSSSFSQFKSFNLKSGDKEEPKLSDKDKSYGRSHRDSRHHERNSGKDHRRSHRSSDSYWKRERSHHRLDHRSSHNDNRHLIEDRMSTEHKRDSFNKKPLTFIEEKRKPIISTTNDTFFMDTTGDKNNLQYEALYQHGICKYRRIGNGRILGLPSNLRIQRNHDNPKSGIVIDEITRDLKSTSQNDFGKLLSQNYHTVKLKQIDCKAVVQQDDYIPIDLGDQPNSNSNNFDLNISGFKSIFSQNNSKLDSQIDEYSIEKYNNEELITLQKEIDSNPKNIKAWKSLIKYHSDHRKKEISNRAHTELIFSILSKALKSNPGHITLTLKYMKYGEEVWKSEVKTERKWRELIDKFPSVPEFLIGFLRFQLHIKTSTSIGFDQILKRLDDIFLSLRSIIMRNNSENSEISLIYGIIMISQFIRRCGYDEMSTALFQALLEINFFRPFERSENRDTKLSFLEKVTVSFKQFWDKELPRIGEKEAKGWLNTIDGTNISLNVTCQPKTELKKCSKENNFQQILTWKENEILLKEFKPSHSTNISEDCVATFDPFNYVLSEDIIPFFYVFEHEVSKKQLIWSALKFWGVDSPFLDRYGLLDTWEDLYDPLQEGDSPSKKHKVVDSEFINNMLSLLKPIQDIELTLWIFDWEFSNNISVALANIKQELQVNRNDIRLWDKYCDFLWKSDEKDQSRKVFKLACQQLKNPHSNLLWCNIIQKELVENRDLEKAWVTLLNFSNSIIEWKFNDINQGTVKIKISTVYNYLSSETDVPLSIENVEHITCLMKIQIMLLFISCWKENNFDPNMEHIVDISNKNADKLNAFSTSCNYNWTINANIRKCCSEVDILMCEIFKVHFTNCSIYKVSQLRQFTSFSLQRSSNNPRIWETLLWNEKKSCVMMNFKNAVDQFITSSSLQELAQNNNDGNSINVSKLKCWQIAIWFAKEMVKSESYVNELFEALVSSNYSDTSSVWKAYIKFRWSLVDKYPEDKSRVLDLKQVCYRAMEINPWDKDIYMVLMDERIIEYVGPVEMNGLIDVMVERQFRFRRSIPSIDQA